MQPAKKIKAVMPTKRINGKLNLSTATARRRRNEMFKTATIIHGGTQSNKDSAEIGLLDAMEHKCSTKNIEEVISSSSKIKNKVIAKIHRTSLKKYENSDRNILRSVATYYTGGG